MKNLILIASLLTASTSFAVPADLICRTRYLGEARLQYSVYLFHKGTHTEATVTTTSSVGFYRPVKFQNVKAYGINGSLVYVQEARPGVGMPQYQFLLNLHSQSKGKLTFGTHTYPVSCVSAHEPIVAL